MKKLIRILSLFLVIIISVFIVSCKSDNAFDYEKDFVDDGTLVYYENSDGYALCGQVNLDMGENVFIPPYYNNKPVNTFGCCWGKVYPTYAELICPLFHNVINLYFSYLLIDIKEHANFSGLVFYVKQFSNPFVLYPENSPEKIFMPSVSFSPKHQYRLIFDYGIQNCFISQSVFEKYKMQFNDINEIQKKIKYHNINFQVANTTFMFNYENSPNEDIFFINDFERGGVIQDVPYKPIREGYNFVGWYKEPECINKWNFETDTLPPAQYDENNELIFVETKLYAKWI